MNKRIQDTLAYKIASHSLPWLMVYLLPIFILGLNISSIQPRMKFMFHINLFLVILFFYLNKYIFIPRFFLKQRFGYFILIVLLSMAFGFLITKVTFTVIIPNTFKDYYNNLENVRIYIENNENFDQLTTEEQRSRMKYFYNNYLRAEPVSNPVKSFFVVILAYAISTAMTVTKKWYQNELQKKELVKDHFETELMFLKSQVNPHFLFNTLNGIYSLAVKKSDKTPETIVKLSALIRYMLYDSNKEYVELEDELNYIRNYIDLQSIRLHDDVRLDFNIKGNTDGKLIAPMLLVTFVENAFKHGIDYTSESFIDVSISVDKDELKLEAINSKNKKKAEQVENNSGIGLKNVKRRLELIYPSKHQLSINDTKDSYKVELTLTLTDHEMLNS